MNFIGKQAGLFHQNAINMNLRSFKKCMQLLNGFDCKWNHPDLFITDPFPPGNSRTFITICSSYLKRTYKEPSSFRDTHILTFPSSQLYQQPNYWKAKRAHNRRHRRCKLPILRCCSSFMIKPHSMQYYYV